MDESLPTHPQLAEIILRRRQEIAAGWAESIQRVLGERFSQSWLDTIPANTLHGVQSMAALLSGGDAKPLREFVTGIGAYRMRHSFEPWQVMEGMLSCKGLVTGWVRSEPGVDPEAALAMSDVLDRMFHWMAALLVRSLASGMTSSLRVQNEQAARLLEIAHNTPEAQIAGAVLDQLAIDIAAAASVDHVNFYLVDEDSRTLIPKLGVNGPVMSAAVKQTFASTPLDIQEDAFFSRVMELKEPLVCYDVAAEPAFVHPALRAMGFKSILAVPLAVRRQVLVLVVIGSLHEHRNYSREQADLVWNIAGIAALAIENARLYRVSSLLLGESEGLQRVASALLQELELDEVLETVCREMLQLTRATGSAIYFLEDDVLRLGFYNGGRPPLEWLPVEHSLAGKALLQGQPVVINRPADHPDFFRPDAAPGNLLVVPLIANGKGIGALLLANKPGDFTSSDTRFTSTFADQAAIAIENARLHQQVHQLAVLEERERLAREIHDNLAQSLSTLKLLSSNVSELLRQGQVEQAWSFLADMTRTASEAHADAREAIFNLRQSASLQGEFLPVLQSYLARYKSTYNIEPHLEVQPGLNPALPPRAGIQVTRIIQEALTNVRKHSGASAVRVRLEQIGESYRFSVEDNGSGFDVDRVLELGGGGVGLHVMRERAQGMGGEVEIISEPGAGTCIVVMIASNLRR